jgi:Tat protein secretion system quality control protein TatD with DNase activity
MTSTITPPQPEPDQFPWHLGVYDAHCHPTDTMSRLASIPQMKARALTVMATRSEDQSLVASAALKHGIKSSSDPAKWSRDERIIPCFGWHPWFAHQLYFDTDDAYSNSNSNSNQDHTPRPLTGAADKISHYTHTLTPSHNPPTQEDQETYLSLPSPLPISTLLSQLRSSLLAHPYALVGEIGLDRSFRIPVPWDSATISARDSGLTPGGREGRRLTAFRCAPAHQRRVLAAQLELAAELGRAVSVHGVQAHGALREVLSESWRGAERAVVSKREKKRRMAGAVGGESALSSAAASEPAQEQEQDKDEDKEKKKPFPPRICLHSYSGGPETFKLYTHASIPARIFASFSTAINLGDVGVDEETPAAFADMIRAVPDHMLLVESDLHTAGDEMDRRLEDIVRRICRIKGWGLDEGVTRLGRNWRAFVFGDE